MIPSDLAARLRFLHEASLFETSPPVAGLQRSREIQTQLQDLIPGQRFFATLQRTLPDGTFRALVAGQQITLSLSASAQAGDTLELIATKVTPGMVLSRLANPDGAAATGSARTNLSPTGQLISFLLTGQPAAKPTLLAGNQPLFNAPPNPQANIPGGGTVSAAVGTQTSAQNSATTSNIAQTGTGTQIAAGTQLAPLLRQALSQSGLFYESHQAQWVAGKMELATLLRDPQAQPAPQQPATPGMPSQSTSTPATSTPATSAQKSADAAQTGNTGASARTEGTPNSSLQAVSRHEAPVSRVNLALQHYNDNSEHPNPIAERLLPVVHQQLEALASHQYTWNGAAWPGQPFEWIVEDPGNNANQEGNDTATEWESTLRLSLPRLGGVEARVSLSALGVTVYLKASSSASADALAARQPELTNALLADNIHLTAITVGHEDEH